MTNAAEQPSTRHTFSVRWSAEDGEWVGTCDSYHSFSWLDPDPLRAMDGILGLVYAEDLDREAAADVAAGRTVVYMDDESFLASLTRGVEQAARGEVVRRDDLLEDDD